tara:strand:- start:81 stop:245 length:165 start_codon:yes stop_codon:yes gene_type:complete
MRKLKQSVIDDYFDISYRNKKRQVLDNDPPTEPIEQKTSPATLPEPSSFGVQEK